MTADGQSPDRIVAVDAVRGFAVLGILAMNIVAFALPLGAYDDPRIAGGTTGWDAVAWAVALAAADGKMRALFTMLFGASLLIVADAAAAAGARPAIVHYRRMAVLLGIGMIHGYLIWYGDILTEYALAGVILFAMWRWRPAALFYIAAIIFAGSVAIAVTDWADLATLRARAADPAATEAVRVAWRAFVAPDLHDANRQIVAYRGDFQAVMAARLTDLDQLQQGLPLYLVEAIGTAAFGMGLFRAGYFTCWPDAWHRRIVVATLVPGFAIGAAAAALVLQSGFEPVTTALGHAIALVVRPLVVIGYASGVILLVRAGRLPWLTDRLAAAGRMALSNYLVTSIVMTTLFYGYGFGWFGTLSRAALYPLVAAMWVAMLAWSRPWLARFRYGPAEWLWRSVARGAPQPLRR